MQWPLRPECGARRRSRHGAGFGTDASEGPRWACVTSPRPGPRIACPCRRARRPSRARPVQSAYAVAGAEERVGPVLTGAAPGAAARARRLWPRAITSMRPGCEETAAGDAEVCPAARERSRVPAGTLLAAAPHGEQLWPRTKMPRGSSQDAIVESAASTPPTDRGIAAEPFVPRKIVETHVRSIFGKLDLPADASDSRHVHALFTCLEATRSVIPAVRLATTDAVVTPGRRSQRVRSPSVAVELRRSRRAGVWLRRNWRVVVRAAARTHRAAPSSGARSARTGVRRVCPGRSLWPRVVRCRAGRARPSRARPCAGVMCA